MIALPDAFCRDGAAASACNHCGKERPPNIESPPTRNTSRRVSPSYVLEGSPRIRNIDIVLPVDQVPPDRTRPHGNAGGKDYATKPLPPAPPPRDGEGGRPFWLPLSASGRGLGGGV